MVGSEQGGVTVTAMETAIQEEALQRYRPYPAYKDSGVDWLGKIPEHWQVKRLRFLVSMNPVASEVRGLAADTEVTFVPMEAIGEMGGLDLSQSKLLDNIGQGYTYFRDGDVVVAKITPCFENGKGALAAGLINGIAFGTTELHVLRPGPDGNPRFLFYVSQSDAFRRLGEAEMYGAGGQKRVPESFVKDLCHTLPNQEEQFAIASFLDRETTRIDALVAKKQRLIELLQEQRTALVTRAVTTDLDARSDAYIAGTEIFPLLPLGWKIRKLRRILTQKKRPVEVQQDSDYQEIGIRSWGRGIFHKEPLKGALLEEKSVYRIQPGDFVLNIVFAWEGAVAIASEQERGMIGSHRFPTFLVSEEVDPDYLLMVFQVGQGRWLMEVNSPGAAGRNKTIRLNQFLDELIPLPPLATQQALVRRVREEEQRLADLTQKLRIAIARLQELRTAVISAAVTGKIDVREEVV